MGVDLARKLLDVMGSEQRFFDMKDVYRSCPCHVQSKYRIYRPIPLQQEAG